MHAYHPNCPCDACGNEDARDEQIEADVAFARAALGLQAAPALTPEARLADEAIRNARALCGGAL